MRAAVERRSPTGSLLGEAERVTPEVALRLFSDRALARSGREKHSQTAPAPRVGLAADLCLLDRPWKIVREDLSSDRVAATFMRGEAIYERPDPR
jgi:predicted amidohydrolase YtcJ